MHLHVALQAPRLAPVQQLCCDDGLEDSHIRSHADFTGVEIPTLQVVESGGRDADPFSHCRVVTTTFRHHAPKVFELHDTLDGRAVNGGGGVAVKRWKRLCVRVVILFRILFEQIFSSLLH